MLPSFNYCIVIILMMISLYIVIEYDNLIKKIIGLNIFQTAIYIFFISLGKVSSGTPPILSAAYEQYSSPLPHVLILTAIVVGISTTAVGLALVIRIKKSFNTIEDDQLKLQFKKLDK